jgi:hypothetical protein
MASSSVLASPRFSASAAMINQGAAFAASRRAHCSAVTSWHGLSEPGAGSLHDR